MADPIEDPSGPWAFTTPTGRQVQIIDLPINVLDPIAKRHNVSWSIIARFPGTYPEAMWDVYAACCKSVDEEPEPEPTTTRGYLHIIEDLMNRVPVDTPTTFQESGVPFQGADDPTT